MAASSDKLKAICGMVLIVAFAGVLATVLTLWITGDSPDRDRYPGKWVKSFPDSIQYQNYDTRDLQGIFQLHLTSTTTTTTSSSTNDARLFLAKQSEPSNNTFVIEVLDYDTAAATTTATTRNSPIGENPWKKTSELETGIDIEQENIRFMLPNSNGSMLAISDGQSVSVYQQTTEQQRSNSNSNNISNDTAWDQLGQTLTKEDLSDWIDPAEVYAFGSNAMAMAIVEEGNNDNNNNNNNNSNNNNLRLNIAARASSDLFTQNISLLEENSHYIIATFFLERQTGRWELDNVQINFVNLYLSDATPVFAGSGNAVAFPRYQQFQNEEWKMVVDIYVYQYEPTTTTTTNGPSTQEHWVKRETLIEPNPAIDNPPPMTHFGMSPESISFSYNGDVVAIGALNFQEDDSQYGRVQVYASETTSISSSSNGSNNDGDAGSTVAGYPQIGQAFKAGDGVFQLGSAVSLSRDGNRLALYYTRDGRGFLQAYQYHPTQNEWLPLGNEINNIHPIQVRAKHISFTGSRIVVAWSCGNTSRIFCFAIYDLQQ